MNVKICQMFWRFMKGALGKKINRAKTALFFSKLTAYEMHLTIKEALGVPVVQQYEK